MRRRMVSPIAHVSWAPAKDIADRDFDLVTMFDCLHDMGDPRGCAKHVRKLLKPSGSWMIVEPIAADHPSETSAIPSADSTTTLRP